MIRRSVMLLLMGAIFLTGLAGGDEPPGDKEDGPLRLKRKKRPDDPAGVKQPGKADKEKAPAKDKDKANDDEPLVPEDGRIGRGAGPGEPEEDEKEVLERVARNMRAVEEKLGNREVGEPTQQQQRDILKDIDSLIKKSEQQSGGGGGADQQPQQNQDQQDQQDQQGKQGGGQQQRQQAGGQGQGSRQMARGSGRRQPRQLRSERGKQKSGRMMAGRQNPGGAPQMPQPKPGEGMNPGGGANPPPGGFRDLDADQVKDIWGHLPESLRAEMNAYSNPQPFLPRYDRLIREYYKTIAEQGRKKGD